MEEDPWRISALLKDSADTSTCGWVQADTVISYLLTSGRYSRVDGQWNFQNNKTKSILLFAFLQIQNKTKNLYGSKTQTLSNSRVPEAIADRQQVLVNA